MFRSKKYPVDFTRDPGSVLLDDFCGVLGGIKLFLPCQEVEMP